MYLPLSDGMAEFGAAARWGSTTGDSFQSCVRKAESKHSCISEDNSGFS